MTAIKSLIQREPVRVAYGVVILAMCVFAGVDAVSTGHATDAYAAIPIFVTAASGEFARAKVSPVAKFVGGLPDEGNLLATLVDDLAGQAVSPQVGPDLMELLPESERPKPPPPPPEPVSEASPGVREPQLPSLSAIVGAVVEELKYQGLVGPAQNAGVPAEAAPEPYQPAPPQAPGAGA